MLSILIPTYNYDIYPLVEALEKQATNSNIIFEIICIDDCSEHILFNKEKLESLEHTQLILLKNNIGRSAIRNLLATKANYENLLFVDAGTFPKSKDFISNYLNVLNNAVTIGGMVNENSPPKKPYKLRWLYTKKREIGYTKKMIQREILTSANFLIKKDIVLSYPFDQTIKTYGFEDLIFFNTLKNIKIPFHFINNPVIHDSKEDANTFVKKTEDGLKNLDLILKKNTTFLNAPRLVKMYSKIKSIGFQWLVITLFKITRPILIRNFNSSFPSLLLFDFYRLGYFCSIKKDS